MYKCDFCDEMAVLYIITVTNHKDELLDKKHLCTDCMKPFKELGLEPGILGQIT